MVHKRHYKHSGDQVVSSWMGSMYGISTYITSKDSIRTWTHLRSHNRMKNAALRENYRHSESITEIRLTVTVLLKNSCLAARGRRIFQKGLWKDINEGTKGGGVLNGTAAGIQQGIFCS